MTDKITNLPASVKNRLYNISKQTERPLVELLQLYGMERFLYRFGLSQYADRFFLKGALMFTVWQVPDRRVTLDIDFLAKYDNHIASIEKVVKDICAITVVSDGIRFDPDTVKGRKIREEADYTGVRVNFIGFIERTRVPMQIDVGFGDVIYPKPETVDYPVILDFPKPHLKGYTVESVVSEKVEAIVKLGNLNTRMKDIYDVWMMMRQFGFKGPVLAEALQRTFKHRKTPLPEHRPFFASDLYDKKSDRQKLWETFTKKKERKHATANLCDTVKEIEDFLEQPLEAISKSKIFNEHWKFPGPWK